MSWRQHKSKTSEADYDNIDDRIPRRRYQSCVGINSDVIVLGGGRMKIYDPNSGIVESVIDENVVSHVMLVPRSLQQLAIKTVYKHHDQLPWKQCLPKPLTKILDIPEPLNIPEDEEHAGNASDAFAFTEEDFPKLMDISHPKRDIQGDFCQFWNIKT